MATPFPEQLSVFGRSRAQFVRICTAHCCRVIWIFSKELTPEGIGNVGLFIAVMNDGDVRRLNRMQTECSRPFRPALLRLSAIICPEV
jgi:hypothetical protein